MTQALPSQKPYRVQGAGRSTWYVMRHYSTVCRCYSKRTANRISKLLNDDLVLQSMNRKEKS